MYEALHPWGRVWGVHLCTARSDSFTFSDREENGESISRHLSSSHATPVSSARVKLHRPTVTAFPANGERHMEPPVDKVSSLITCSFP